MIVCIKPFTPALMRCVINDVGEYYIVEEGSAWFRITDSNKSQYIISYITYQHCFRKLTEEELKQYLLEHL